MILPSAGSIFPMHGARDEGRGVHRGGDETNPLNPASAREKRGKSLRKGQAARLLS